MSASQETERVNLASDWPDKPAIYNLPPQDDTARFFHAHLMKLLRSGKKLDKEEMAWVNTYNKYKARNRNKEEVDEYVEEHSKKDLQLFFMDKIADLQNKYEDRILKMQTHYEDRLGKKDERIDQLTEAAEKRRHDSHSESLKILSDTYSKSAQVIEKAHDSSNKGLVTALEKTTSLNQTLTSGIEERTKRTLDKERTLIEELKKISEQEQGPGFWETLFTEVIAPNKDKIGEALSKLSGPLLTDLSK